MLAEVAGAAYVGIRLLERQLRHGVVAASSREASRRSAPPRSAAASSAFTFGSVVQRRELRLLSRDRAFLVQTLVLPLVVVGSQVLLNGRFNVTTTAMSSATTAAIAFGVAAYTLMASAFQTLNSEGASLWILYTVPRPLATVLLEKAQLWAVLALVYPVAIFSIGFAFSHHVGIEFVGLAAVALLGVPIYAAIAVALGVFASDPLATQVQQRVRPTYVYLYMLLAGLYTYAIFASHWSQRLVLIVLSALLAMALGQKARDELPFLLDPAASPPSKVSTSDGVIAAMLFFVFQGLVAAGLSAGGSKLDGSAVLLSYSIAGALTYAALRFSLWRSRAEGVPRLLAAGASLFQAMRWGGVTGLVAAFAGLIYVAVTRHLELPIEVRGGPNAALFGVRWAVPLAIIAAPLCEEFIFRGLIYGGMRRSIPEAWALCGSAAVFAIVHPPMAMIPVFGLGICAAVAYRRTGGLLAPMLTHALYNGAVIAITLSQW
jgi:ABC-2 type transport system permease protein